MNYSIWNSIRFHVGIFLWFLITIAVFLVGWGMAFTSVDLNKSQQILGIIESTAIQQNRSSKAVAGQHDFIIYINGNSTGFWIYRASQNYFDLNSKLTVGSPVKIYCNYKHGSNGYYTAYQVEKGNDVIYSKDEYEGKEKLAGRFIALPGAFILLYMLYREVRKRYRPAKNI